MFQFTSSVYFYMQTTKYEILTLQPIGGGFLARSIMLLTITLNRLYLAPPNLVTFCSYLLDTFWQNFSKIDSPGGAAAVVFEMRRLKKLNIIMNFLFRFNLKPWKCRGGIDLCQERCFQA